MLGSGETLIQKTFSRLSQLIPKENILVLTHEKYNDIVMEQLPSVSQEQIILEPAMRNTAPCILYASMKIQKMNPNALMVVAPSDHWIEDEMQFVANLQRAFDFFTFAVDDERSENNEVIPGIGGMVYTRLGLGDMDSKNSYMPQIVLDRLL